MATDPVTPVPRRFSIRLPRPLWIGVAAVLLLVIAGGLRIGIPIYRQEVAIREIKRVKGSVEMVERGPDWLRDWLGSERMRIVDEVDTVFLWNARNDDRDLVQLRWLPGDRS